MNIEQLLTALTVEEKAALVSGVNFMYTNSVKRLNIPSLRMSDGPHGLRVQTSGGDNGVTGSEPATVFPTAATTASGWNEENLIKMGNAIADECLNYGVNIVLGPAVNIKRNPLCGRNFEYFSEDPYLTAKMAIAEINGLQSKGIGASVKHFALNNSENYRFMSDSVADMRAIREFYLKAYESIVKEARPYTMMCAYNKINGTYCSENKWLLTDVLREEWGFDGTVMTDWGAIRERVDALKSGLDLEMPGDAAICRRKIIDGVNSNILDIKELDKAVANILKLIERCGKQKKYKDTDWVNHHLLSGEIASDCAVLLKNDGVLPLDKTKKFLIVGNMFVKMRYQGAGSSMINPTYLTTPQNAFDEENIEYEFTAGYEEYQTAIAPQLISEAVKMAGNYNEIVVFAGLTDMLESEGSDRENLRLPKNQLQLIDALVKTGKKIIVVLYGGSVMELPFANSVSSILNMFLPGQNGGTATMQLLFGDKNPSGKLAETWVKSYDDVPFGGEYSKKAIDVYKESVFVGYRYYLTAKTQVRYPFGYGLSYTTFEYKDISVTEGDTSITINCLVNNSGNYYGAEVVQLYVKSPKKGVFKPEKELKAFTKIYLKVNESKKISLAVNKSELKYWNVKLNRWVLEDGEYELQICSDCQTVKLYEKIKIVGENAAFPYDTHINNIYSQMQLSMITDSVFEQMSGLKIPILPPKKPIRLESRFSDLQYTFMGKILYNSVLSVAKKQMKKAEKLPDGQEKDNQIKGAFFLKRILESNSIRSMSMASGNRFPYNFALGFVNLANGKILKGIKCFCSKVRVPKLPDIKEDK